MPLEVPQQLLLWILNVSPPLIKVWIYLTKQGKCTSVASWWHQCRNMEMGRQDIYVAPTGPHIFLQRTLYVLIQLFNECRRTHQFQLRMLNTFNVDYITVSRDLATSPTENVLISWTRRGEMWECLHVVILLINLTARADQCVVAPSILPGFVFLFSVLFSFHSVPSLPSSWPLPRNPFQRVILKNVSTSRAVTHRWSMNYHLF